MVREKVYPLQPHFWIDRQIRRSFLPTFPLGNPFPRMDRLTRNRYRTGIALYTLEELDDRDVFFT